MYETSLFEQDMDMPPDIKYITGSHNDTNPFCRCWSYRN